MTTVGKTAFFVCALAFGSAAWMVGCGGRTFTGAQDGALANNHNTNQNANTNQNHNQNNNNIPGECQTADDCLPALKWDQCCACPVSASQDDLEADPCLIPLLQSHIPDECIVDCPAVECPPCASHSWTAACTNGTCTWQQGRCTQNTDCVIALPVHDCCLAAYPATHDDIDEDPCLLYWSQWSYEVPETCQEQWRPECASFDCAPSGPPTRGVQCGTDGCQYVEECNTVEDCALLLDTRQCCPCPQAWPAFMATHDPCLIHPGEQTPVGCPPAYCDTVLCEPCPSDMIMECQGTRCISVWPAYD